MVAVSEVALTNAVGVAMPLTSIWLPRVKPVPVAGQRRVVAGASTAVAPVTADSAGLVAGA